jgi:SprT protein
VTDTEIRQRVEDRLDELLLIVNHRTHGFGMPELSYYDNKACAGTATGSRAIALNMPMLRDNLDSMLHETVAHELAHLVVHHCYLEDGGPKPKPHGPEWQDVMRNWFGVEPETTHNYDVSTSNVRRQNRWEAKCSCRTHAITTTKQMKMAVDGARYSCRSCGCEIELTGRRA